MSVEAFDVSKVTLLDKVLGRGAFGTVRLGLHKETGRQVAVKEVSFPATNCSRAKEGLERAAVEISLMKQFRHRNVVEYLGARREGMTLWIFMGYCSGGSLKGLIQNTGPLPVEVARKFLRQILHGLRYLHAMSICHRDIKTDNVLLSPDGTAKLGDFGTAKPIQDCMSLCSGLASVCGTPWYMAPEIIIGENYGLPVDIWSVGCTLYEMLTGSHPFKEFENPHTAMYRIASERCPPKVPEGFGNDYGRDLVVRCCRVDPRKRPSCGGALRHGFFEETDIEEEEEEEEQEDSEIEDYSADGEVILPSPTVQGILPVCGGCGENFAIFMCGGCRVGCCPRCWDLMHDGHKKSPMLFSALRRKEEEEDDDDDEEGSDPSFTSSSPIPSDTVLFSSLSDGGGLVTSTGQYVELLIHPSHQGPCSLDNSGNCHLSLRDDGVSWNCARCTYMNHEELVACEVCEHPR